MAQVKKFLPGFGEYGSIDDLTGALLVQQQADVPAAPVAIGKGAWVALPALGTGKAKLTLRSSTSGDSCTLTVYTSSTAAGTLTSHAILAQTLAAAVAVAVAVGTGRPGSGAYTFELPLLLSGAAYIYLAVTGATAANFTAEISAL
jgi:hypothetical protein